MRIIKITTLEMYTRQYFYDCILFCKIFFNILSRTSEDLWVQCSSNNFFVFFKPVALKLECESESPGRWLLGLILRDSDSGGLGWVWEFACLLGSQVMLMMLNMDNPWITTAFSHFNLLILQFNLVRFSYHEACTSPWFRRS